MNFRVFRFLKVTETHQISDSLRYASQDYAEIWRYLLNFRDTKNGITIIHEGHTQLCKNGSGNLFIWFFFKELRLFRYQYFWDKWKNSRFWFKCSPFSPQTSMVSMRLISKKSFFSSFLGILHENGLGEWGDHCGRHAWKKQPRFFYNYGFVF